jgi:hypothetical protein
MLADILCSPRAAATFSMFRNKILGYENPPAVSGDGVAPITDAHGRTDVSSAKASSGAHKDSGNNLHKQASHEALAERPAHAVAPSALPHAPYTGSTHCTIESGKAESRSRAARSPAVATPPGVPLAHCTATRKN